MNTKQIQLAVAVVVFLLLGGLFFLYFSEHGQRIQKEQELKSKIMELNAMQQAIDTLTKKKADIEASLNAKISSLESTIKENEESAKALTERVQALEKEKTSVMDDNLEKTKTVEDLNKKISDLEESKTELFNKIMELEEQLGGQEKPEEKKKIENTPYGVHPMTSPKMDAVNLGKIIVQKSSGHAAQVSQVNPVYNFIVINVGQRDGVEEGTVINIVRDDHLIGKAVVQKARSTVAAAILLPEWTKEPIEPGDFVTRF